MSHLSTVRLIGDIGRNHDVKVKDWRNELTTRLRTVEVNSVLFVYVH